MFKLKTWMSLSIMGGLLIASTSFASNSPAPAPYVGAQIGWGKVHLDAVGQSDVQRPGVTVTSFSSSLNNDTGWAGRLFIGYLVSPMWGIEFGWSKFRNVSNRVAVTWSDGLTLNTNPSVKTDAIDLMLKGIYYFQPDINVYGKIGAAYIMQRGEANATVGGTSISVQKDVNRVYPTFALGLGYDFACNWTADVSWTRIQKVGSSEASSTDLAAVGLIYKIV